MKFFEYDPANGRQINGLMDECYEKFASVMLAMDRPLFITTPLELTADPICHPGSDAVTRTVQKAGFWATRERHSGHTTRSGEHYLTSLASPFEEPKDSDIIICLTWGQFVDRDDYDALITTLGDRYRPGYMGPREGIREFVDDWNYTLYFSPESVMSRSVTYARNPEFPAEGIHVPKYMWHTYYGRGPLPDDVRPGKVEPVATSSAHWDNTV